MATFKIDTPSARAKLATRTSPYWHKVQTNRFVGFRYMTEGSEGSWIAKLRRQGGEERFAMGKLTEVEPGQRFAHALKLAAKWFAELETTGHAVSTVVPYKMTLMQALEAYTLEQGKKTRDGKPDFGAKTMNDVKRRFEQVVTPWPSPEDSWVDRPLARIKAADFVKWRQWLEGRTNSGRGSQNGAPLSVETINRYLVNVTAALNLASEMHGIPNVWKRRSRRPRSTTAVGATRSISTPTSAPRS